jgi:hypothetical protein
MPLKHPFKKEMLLSLSFFAQCNLDSAILTVYWVGFGGSGLKFNPKPNFFLEKCNWLASMLVAPRKKRRGIG